MHRWHARAAYCLGGLRAAAVSGRPRAMSNAQFHPHMAHRPAIHADALLLSSFLLSYLDAKNAASSLQRHSGSHSYRRAFRRRPQPPTATAAQQEPVSPLSCFNFSLTTC